ncbi:GNAT family N-acetyltransferase [Bdellovibrio sp. GT3]|uniref:GNAT family N-acetyltransferase n=1 Tax=Bdellovibrio sp. GT3 TaxID=3136282 RepID=UPI0030F16872
MSLYEIVKPNLTDYEFLKNVHHITLKPHVEKIWGWEETRQDAFFKEDFESGQIQLLRAFNQLVGYLQLNEENGTLFIVNILILPEFQNRKLGSAIIKDLIVKYGAKGVPLKLGVFKINTRAKCLYEALGFKIDGESETHFSMSLLPE